MDTSLLLKTVRKRIWFILRFKSEFYLDHLYEFVNELPLSIQLHALM